MFYPNSDSNQQPVSLQQLLTQQLASQLQQQSPYAPQAQLAQTGQQAMPWHQTTPWQQPLPWQQALAWQQPQAHQSRLLGLQALQQIAQSLQILAHHLNQVAVQQLLAQQAQQGQPAPFTTQSVQQPGAAVTQPYASGPAVH